ncbi:MAG: PilX N-terminal domain-containing pilus assembly protein [Bacillus sp. (in: Bacteria)]|nr:PilX N-terminal domain-containing pilus assembly protein [Bacillus sp. (in: firmicutes)]
MLVWKNAKEKIVNQRGYTLILVLLVIVVLSISGVSIMGVTASNTKRSSGDRDHQAVYYIAEAGATLKMEEIKEVITQTYELTHVQNAYVFLQTLILDLRRLKKIQ